MTRHDRRKNQSCSQMKTTKSTWNDCWGDWSWPSFTGIWYIMKIRNCFYLVLSVLQTLSFKKKEGKKKQEKKKGFSILPHASLGIMNDTFFEIKKLFWNQVPSFKSLFFSFEVTRSSNDRALYHKSFKELYLLLFFNQQSIKTPVKLFQTGG